MSPLLSPLLSFYGLWKSCRCCLSISQASIGLTFDVFQTLIERSIRQTLGAQPAGLVHAVVHDLYKAANYVATEIFEISQVSEDLFELSTESWRGSSIRTTRTSS